jgi:hypothetical protein
VSFSSQSIGTLSPHKDHHIIGVSCFDYKDLGNKKSDPSARAQKNMAKLSLLVTIALSGIGTWRDFDSLDLCLVLNALALVLIVLAENLDALKCWWLGVFIVPTTKVAVGEGYCRRAHRTVRCAIGHCAVRQPRHPIVGVRPLELLTTGPPDSPVVHQTVTVHCPVRLLAPALTLRAQSRTVHCCFCRRPLAQ